MGFIYLKALIICFLIGLTASFILEGSSSQLPQQSVQGQNLGFSNRTGPNTTKAQTSNFINFVNSASTFYKNDTQTRLQYISDKMNSLQVNSSFGFSVIQMDNENDFDQFFYSLTKVFASYSSGIDKIFPLNSYAFLYENIHSPGRVYLSEVGQKGPGIDSKTETAIKKAINAAQTSSTCQCTFAPNTIAAQLNNYDGSYWNVFCSASNSFSAVFYPYNDRYIYTRPKHCFYLLYQFS